MFITKEILQKYNACEPGIKIFEELYPNGTEIKTLISENKVPISILHWGYEKLPVTEDEIQLYRKVIEIDSSTETYNSERVFLSHCVNSSKNVTKGINIFRSKNIQNCSNVFNSTDIYDSSNISVSRKIRNSEKILFSKQITNSENIVRSTSVINSDNIFGSSDIYSSIAIRNCDSSINSIFCAECSNIIDSLFCFDVKDSGQMIFNKPSTKLRVEELKEEIMRFHLELSFLKEKNFENPKVDENISNHYSLMGDSFWKWIRALPEYDPFILYQITFKPNLLFEN